MTAGDILKLGLLRVEKWTVKSSEDIELGEIVCDDGSGNGCVAATAALAVTEKVGVALESHDYSEVDSHYIMVGVAGEFDVQKVSGSGAAKFGDKLMLSTTSGEVTKFVKGDAPTGGVSTYYTTTIETNVQAAMDKNLGIIGTATETTTNSDTTQKILLGVY